LRFWVPVHMETDCQGMAVLVRGGVLVFSAIEIRLGTMESQVHVAAVDG